MRIVLSTWGSLGDLHPLVAVGLELKRRGHVVVFATNAGYGDRLTALGFEFHELAPHIDADDSRVIGYLMDFKRGPERLLRELLLPALPEMYRDLQAAASGADLVVANELVYAAPILAETSGICWATIVLAPLSFFSLVDPPVVPSHVWLSHVYRIPGIMPLVMRFGRAVTKPWIGPVTAFRKALGLPQGPHPVFEGKFSPELVLAMFSRVMGEPQRDWPPNTAQTGFVFYDEAGMELPPDVRAFLEAGEAPVVFTLGSSAVLDPGRFFDESIGAALLLGRRALLIAGDYRPPHLPEAVHVTPYAPYAKVFSAAAAVVHQGGIGTTAQVLRAGRPMVIVPYAFDQPDNAGRAIRLGVAATVPRHRYDAKRAAAVLTNVLGNAAYGENAARIAQTIRDEDGVRAACDAILAAAQQR